MIRAILESIYSQEYPKDEIEILSIMMLLFLA